MPLTWTVWLQYKLLSHRPVIVAHLPFPVTLATLEDIDSYNDAAGMERIQIISADGPSDYMRQMLNAMDEKTFQTFIDYHLTTCERPELVGAGSHTVDIIRKKKDGE